MSKLFIPQGYKPLLDLRETEMGIHYIKDFFQQNLSAELRLRRVTAPLFVLKGTGLNDDLNGVERAVTFPIKDLDDRKAEVVHSLAKWKRMILADYGIEEGFGIYTDMNAIRSDEELDNTHSLYVDQWDWEMVMPQGRRDIEYLKNIVERIYGAMKRTEYIVCEHYPQIRPQLPETIHFVYADDLAAQYPDLTPKQREDIVTRQYGAVFIMGIGGPINGGEPHDGRAPDYDDWALNGDILMWNPVLECAFELSSMGIRVDEESLDRQLHLAGCDDRRGLPFHKMLLAGQLPLTMGGGIGQSRLCMLMIGTCHIGEVQCSLWDEATRSACEEAGIMLL